MKIIYLSKTPVKKVVQKTLAVLKKGGLVVYPTETCYGLGADATNTQAVDKLFCYKGKRLNQGVSVAVTDQEMASQYVIINETGQNLYQNFLPGPLTVVSKSRHKVVPKLEADNQSLGIRIPDYPLIIQLIKAFGKPITSTSANTSGKKTPYSYQDLHKYTTQKRLVLIDLFLDAGKLPQRQPSTVVDTVLNEAQILRQGKILLTKGQTLISHSENETKKIAQKIFWQFQHLLNQQPLIIALQGELGTGKTQFVKGIAKAVKITANVTSPTFVLLKEYPYQQGMLYHLDTWRLEKGEEILNLGLEKMLEPKNIICIEWLEKVKPILENIAKKYQIKIIWVTIDYLQNNQRLIKHQ